MYTWILILWMTGNFGNAITTQEFDGDATVSTRCIAAGQQMKKQMIYLNRGEFNYICVRKS